MSRSFLAYWLRDQIRNAVQGGPLDHAASNQLDRCNPGDELWIVGPGTDAKLVTVGPLVISELVGQREAARRLPYEPWEARHHALADSGTAAFPREVALDGVIEQLRIVSPKRPHLDAGRPLGQQLQTMREITAESATMIRRLWGGAVRTDQEDFDSLQSSLDSLGELDVQREVLVRREQAFLRRQLLRGDAVGICVICGDELPAELLVAAHIKPRALCSDLERRDYLGNVVLMCRLGCDALFETGLICVDDGVINAYVAQGTAPAVAAPLEALRGYKTPSWTPRRIKYFSWHSANVAAKRASNRGAEPGFCSGHAKGACR